MIAAGRCVDIRYTPYYLVTVPGNRGQGYIKDTRPDHYTIKLIVVPGNDKESIFSVQIRVLHFLRRLQGAHERTDLPSHGLRIEI
jgi:hypothetical protein